MAPPPGPAMRPAHCVRCSVRYWSTSGQTSLCHNCRREVAALGEHKACNMVCRACGTAYHSASGKTTLCTICRRQDVKEVPIGTSSSTVVGHPSTSASASASTAPHSHLLAAAGAPRVQAYQKSAVPSMSRGQQQQHHMPACAVEQPAPAGFDSRHHHNHHHHREAYDPGDGYAPKATSAGGGGGVAPAKGLEHPGRRGEAPLAQPVQPVQSRHRQLQQQQQRRAGYGPAHERTGRAPPQEESSGGATTGRRDGSQTHRHRERNDPAAHAPTAREVPRGGGVERVESGTRNSDSAAAGELPAVPAARWAGGVGPQHTGRHHRRRDAAPPAHDGEVKSPASPRAPARHGTITRSEVPQERPSRALNTNPPVPHGHGDAPASLRPTPHVDKHTPRSKRGDAKCRQGVGHGGEVHHLQQHAAAYRPEAARIDGDDDDLSTATDRLYDRVDALYDDDATTSPGPQQGGGGGRVQKQKQPQRHPGVVTARGGGRGAAPRPVARRMSYGTRSDSETEDDANADARSTGTSSDAERLDRRAQRQQQSSLHRAGAVDAGASDGTQSDGELCRHDPRAHPRRGGVQNPRGQSAGARRYTAAVRDDDDDHTAVMVAAKQTQTHTPVFDAGSRRMRAKAAVPRRGAVPATVAVDSPRVAADAMDAAGDVDIDIDIDIDLADGYPPATAARPRPRGHASQRVPSLERAGPGSVVRPAARSVTISTAPTTPPRQVMGGSRGRAPAGAASRDDRDGQETDVCCDVRQLSPRGSPSAPVLYERPLPPPPPAAGQTQAQMQMQMPPTADFQSLATSAAGSGGAGVLGGAFLPPPPRVAAQPPQPERDFLGVAGAEGCGAASTQPQQGLPPPVPAPVATPGVPAASAMPPPPQPPQQRTPSYSHPTSDATSMRHATHSESTVNSDLLSRGTGPAVVPPPPPPPTYYDIDGGGAVFASGVPGGEGHSGGDGGAGYPSHGAHPLAGPAEMGAPHAAAVQVDAGAAAAALPAYPEVVTYRRGASGAHVAEPAPAPAAAQAPADAYAMHRSVTGSSGGSHQQYPQHHAASSAAAYSSYARRGGGGAAVGLDRYEGGGDGTAAAVAAAPTPRPTSAEYNFGPGESYHAVEGGAVHRVVDGWDMYIPPAAPAAAGDPPRDRSHLNHVNTSLSLRGAQAGYIGGAHLSGYNAQPHRGAPPSMNPWDAPMVP